MQVARERTVSPAAADCFGGIASAGLLQSNRSVLSLDGLLNAEREGLLLWLVTEFCRSRVLAGMTSRRRLPIESLPRPERREKEG